MGTDRQGRRSPLRRRSLNAFARFHPRPLRRAHALALAGGSLLGAGLWLAVPPAAHPASGDPAAVVPGGPAAVVRGAVHIHSTYSDGSGSPAEIAAAARRAGLDFVVLTDHGDGTRPPAPPAYRSGVLCLDGVEISTDGGHYLALGLGRAPYPLGGEAAGVVEDVARLGGFGVVAHPASPRPELAWRDWSLPVDGVEWLNADSQWRDERLVDLAAAALGYGFRAPESLATILDRPVAALARWDAESAERRVVGLGGADAHARIPLAAGDGHEGGGRALRFPSYETLFRTFSVRVELPVAWTGDARADAELLLDALREGRTFTVIDALAGLGHFSFRGRSGAAAVAMGERVDGTERVALEARAGGPPEREIVLLRQGKAVARTHGAVLRFDVPAAAAPAAYRVEVRLPRAPGTPPVPWIAGNPIYVGRPPAPEPRPPPAPEPRAHPAPVAAAVTLDAPGRWRAERSDDSAAAVERTGRDVRLRFRLGAGPGRFAAAAYALEPEVPLRGAVLFDAMASRPLRASLQLRSSSGDGDLRWRRSFHAGPAPAPVRIDLDDLTPVGSTPPRGPGARGDSLLVVVDAVNTARGTAGVLTLRGPRLVAPRRRVRLRCAQPAGSRRPCRRTARSGPKPPGPARGGPRCRWRRRC